MYECLTWSLSVQRALGSWPLISFMPLCKCAGMIDLQVGGCCSDFVPLLSLLPDISTLHSSVSPILLFLSLICLLSPLASWLSHPSPLALALAGPAHPGSFIMGQEGSPWACRLLSAPAIASLWLLANKCWISKSLLKPGGPFSANWVRVTEPLSVLLRELFVSPPFADTDPHKINDF